MQEFSGVEFIHSLNQENSMRTFVITMLFFGITTASRAEDLKPGTPEWDRHFEQLRNQGKKSAKDGKTRALKSPAGTQPKNRAGSAELQAELKKDMEKSARERNRKELQSLPAKYQAAFADAQSPPPFQREQAASAEASIRHMQKAVADAKKLDDIIPYLSAPFRKRLIQKLAGQSQGYDPRTPEEELAFYKTFFASITEYQSSAGSGNENIAYGYVWTKGKSEVLYQVELVGEGQHWRLNGWTAQQIRQ